MNLRLICALALVGIHCRSEAYVIAGDDFAYPAGPVSGLNGGVGFAGAFAGIGAINSGNLAYTDASGLTLTPSGNRVSTTTSGNGMVRTLSTVGRPSGLLTPAGRFGATGSQIYLGFLIRLNSGSVFSFGDYGGVSLFFGSTEEIFFGDLGFEARHIFWGVDPQVSSTAVRESTVPVDSTVRFLVARIDFGATFETVRMYVDPSLAAEPVTPTIGPFAVPTFDFDRIRIQGGGNGRYDVDEFAMATTFAEVIPEPASGTLAASACVWALLRLRRRNCAR